MGPEPERVLKAGIDAMAPPSGAKQRGWARLQERIEPPHRAWLPAIVVVAIAAAVLLVWGIAGSIARRRTADEARPEAVDLAAPPPPVRAVDPPPAPAVPVPPPSAPVPAPSIAPPTPPSPPVQTPDPLAREVTLVERGQQALTEGRFADALQIAREHRRRFSGGALEEDARALEIAALCRLDRRDDAARAAADLRATAPDSELARALAAAPCGNRPAP